jgi:hypothetical protein
MVAQYFQVLVVFECIKYWQRFGTLLPHPPVVGFSERFETSKFSKLQTAHRSFIIDNYALHAHPSVGPPTPLILTAVDATAISALTSQNFQQPWLFIIGTIGVLARHSDFRYSRDRYCKQLQYGEKRN